MAQQPAKHPPTPIVALAGWLVPGGGYWVLGQRARALTVGITVVALFVAGLLLGGVRIIQVPMYNERGARVDARLVQEVGAKPWSITQALVGPVGIAGGAASVWASRPPAPRAEPPGALVHGRLNDIAVLYTAVAGMLNLLAIIDAAYRSGQPGSAPDAPGFEPVGSASNGERSR